MSRWMLPSAPVLPPPLSAVEGLGGRQYHAKSRDVPYAALQGQEVMPQRPHVVYVTGGWCVTGASVCCTVSLSEHINGLLDMHLVHS
jgi:hypothetical protein